MASPVTPAREGHQPLSPRSVEPVEKKGYRPRAGEPQALANPPRVVPGSGGRRPRRSRALPSIPGRGADRSLPEHDRVECGRREVGPGRVLEGAWRDHARRVRGRPPASGASSSTITRPAAEEQPSRRVGHRGHRPRYRQEDVRVRSAPRPHADLGRQGSVRSSRWHPRGRAAATS